MDSDINLSEVRSLVKDSRKAINHASSLFAQEVWGNIGEFAPKKTGRLAGSFKLDQVGERTHSIYSNVKYAAVQNWGSDPYMIYPRQAQALRFKIKGQWIFAKEVLHPGINPTYYIEGGISAAEQRIDEFVAIALDKEGLT